MVCAGEGWCARCRARVCAVLIRRAIRPSERQHVEVVVALRPGADPGVVAEWLRRRGLDVMPLVVGVLATGDASAVRAAFGPDLGGALAVPEELRADVESIALVPPKRLHEGA